MPAPSPVSMAACLPATATVLVLGRLCDPSSELHLAERFYESSALTDLLSVPAEKVNEDRLYRALDALLPHKPALEKHLKEKLGEEVTSPNAPNGVRANQTGPLLEPKPRFSARGAIRKSFLS